MPLYVRPDEADAMVFGALNGHLALTTPLASPTIPPPWLGSLTLTSRSSKPGPRKSQILSSMRWATVKGFLSVIAAAPPNRRTPVTAEFTKMLSLYLEAKFR